MIALRFGQGKRTQVLHDVLMLQIFEEFDFPLQSVQHASLTCFIRRGIGRDVDLLDSHKKTVCGVHPEIHFSERASSYQCSLDPLDTYRKRVSTGQEREKAM